MYAGKAISKKWYKWIRYLIPESTQQTKSTYNLQPKLFGVVKHGTTSTLKQWDTSLVMDWHKSLIGNGHLNHHSNICDKSILRSCQHQSTIKLKYFGSNYLKIEDNKLDRIKQNKLTQASFLHDFVYLQWVSQPSQPDCFRQPLNKRNKNTHQSRELLKYLTMVYHYGLETTIIIMLQSCSVFINA
jgi:hypothetical protein